MSSPHVDPQSCFLPALNTSKTSTQEKQIADAVISDLAYFFEDMQMSMIASGVIVLSSFSLLASTIKGHWLSLLPFDIKLKSDLMAVIN